MGKKKTLQPAEPEAIILLGHGSRVPGAGEEMERAARRLQERLRAAIVETCYLSRLGPHFPEVFDRCVARGAKKVVVIPYFLHMGLHILLDIPEVLQAKAREHPQVKVILGKHLGGDEALVDLLMKRIDQSRELEDIRTRKLPPKEKYPVPPGQCEFIAVPPKKMPEGP